MGIPALAARIFSDSSSMDLHLTFAGQGHASDIDKMLMILATVDIVRNENAGMTLRMTVTMLGQS